MVLASGPSRSVSAGVVAMNAATCTSVRHADDGVGRDVREDGGGQRGVDVGDDGVGRGHVEPQSVDGAPAPPLQLQALRGRSEEDIPQGTLWLSSPGLLTCVSSEPRWHARLHSATIPARVGFKFGCEWLTPPVLR